MPHTRRVVGVQYARQRLGCQSPGQSRNEVATAEFLEIEIIRCCRCPQAEGVYVLSRNPTTGRSKGTPITVNGLPVTARKVPSCTANEQFSGISTFWFGRGTSQGSSSR